MAQDKRLSSASQVTTNATGNSRLQQPQGISFKPSISLPFRWPNSCHLGVVFVAVAVVVVVVANSTISLGCWLVLV